MDRAEVLALPKTSGLFTARVDCKRHYNNMHIETFMSVNLKAKIFLGDFSIRWWIVLKWTSQD
jgi:hypothetical protein